MKLLFILLYFTFSICFASDNQFVITSILTDENINVQRIDSNVEIKFGDMMVILSHDSNQVLGYAKVLSVTEESDLFVARVETHDKNGLIRTGNYLRKINLLDPKADLPSRYDLTVKEEGKVAAKFRPLAYTGISNGWTASNLYKKEVIAGPTVLAYGLTSWLQVHTNLISSMFKVLNLGIKTKIFEKDDLQFSIENTFQYYHLKRKGSYLFTGYFDSNSNSNFKSYAKIKIFTSKPSDQYLYNSDEYNKDVNVELQFSYGYLFNNWNQLIFGPKVDVEKKKIGGLLGYYILDKDVNTMFGLSANDFSEFRLGKQAYMVNFDLWWRF